MPFVSAPGCAGGPPMTRPHSIADRLWRHYRAQKHIAEVVSWSRNVCTSATPSQALAALLSAPKSWLSSWSLGMGRGLTDRHTSALHFFPIKYQDTLGACGVGGAHLIRLGSEVQTRSRLQKRLMKQ